MVLVTLAAALLRLWHLDQLPPGLWYDEAVNGVDIRMVLSGKGLPVYFTANNGREPLFIYLQALSTALLGPTPYALRIVAAITGILTVPAVYWCGLVLFARGSQRPQSAGGRALLGVWAPLLASAALAVCYWHLSLSRLGLRAVLLPLTSTLAAGFFWKAWTGGRWRDYVLAGVCLAAALYSYLAARLLPFVLLGFVGIEAALAVYARSRHLRSSFDARNWKSTAARLAVLALVTAALCLPLAVALSGASTMADRSSQVSILAGVPFSEGLRRIGANTVVALRAFYDRGDANLRHNLPGRPATDILLAALFTLGWLTALWRGREPRYRFLLIWFGVMLLPTILSIEAPHSLRASGALPPFALFCGLGGVTLAGRAATPAGRRSAAFALCLAVLLVSGGLTARDYFVRWAQSAGLGAIFSVQEQLAAEAAAEFLASGSADSGMLVSDRLFTQPQMVYALGLLPQTPLGAAEPDTQPQQTQFVLEDNFDSRQPMYLLSKNSGSALSTPLEPLSNAAAASLQERMGAGLSARVLGGPGQQGRWGKVFEGRLPSDIPLSDRQIANPMSVTFANGVKLLGYDIDAAPPAPTTQLPQIRLTLFWELARTKERPVTAWAFLHLANEQGVWEQQNGPLPQSYLYPWLEDSRQIQDTRLVPVPVAMPAGKAYFEAGLYQADFATPNEAGPRVGIVDGQGHVAADQVDLAPTTVRAGPAQADLAGLRPLSVTYDDRISLLGWSAARDIEDPTRLRVDLSWRADRRSTTDYTSFVHLIDSSEKIVAQSDQPPGGERNGTSRWVPGETVRTTAYLKLDPGLDLAPLRLRVGLYELVSGKQLAVTHGAPGQQSTFVLLPLTQAK